jgi:two-component system, cell cycle sensor histidine kinase and response regulator CckA
VTTPGGETILLVEDHDAVRKLVTELLEVDGYAVLAAGDSAEAIEIAEQRHGAIDLLLTDVVLPGVNGHELAELLVARHPGLKVLFTSGYPAQTGVGNLGDERVAFIQKPYLPNDLARAVREVLAGPSA